MRCRFFEETRVARCLWAASQKMIARPLRAAAAERCSGSAYVSCSVYREHAGESEPGARCPFLEEMQAQYCAAAPKLKYIPASESLICRCGTDASRYCSNYLSLVPDARAEDKWAGDIRVPAHLLFTANHLWLDPGDGETWHVGVDGFLAKVLHRVERVSFLTTAGERCPAAVLTARGVDLQVVFPQALRISATHSYLRASPEALTADPYGQGWLFEGAGPAVRSGLLEATAAADWTRREVDRLSSFAGCRPGAGTCADGGLFADDLLEHLSREEILTVFHEFFSPAARPESL